MSERRVSHQVPSRCSRNRPSENLYMLEPGLDLNDLNFRHEVILSSKHTCEFKLFVTGYRGWSHDLYILELFQTDHKV